MKTEDNVLRPGLVTTFRKLVLYKVLNEEIPGPACNVDAPLLRVLNKLLIPES